MKDKATIKDVAQHAGVSTATVSRVLSNSGPVSAELRGRVEQAIQALGYRPSRMARSFRAQRSKFIGLIISDVENPFYTSLVRAVEDVAYAHDYSLLLCNSDEDPDKERAYIQFMADERVAGVIGSPASEAETSFAALLDAGIPVVSVDRRSTCTPVDTVLLDHVTAARDLARHLIAHGHQRIGAILPNTSITSGRERLAGFLQAMEEVGLTPDPALIHESKGIEAFGAQATHALLDLPDRPTAIFTGNNLITLGALKAIQERRLRIPDDIAVAGLDEMPWMSLLAPGITVAAQPIHEMGRLAMHMLLERIAGDRQPLREVKLAPRLVIRSSVATPAFV
ncbi:MAG: LacI family transcriptional regulator [Chloroflexi bacterium]|jgi:DNA-binding LacI/PurR family transcriptional regulator|uniref:LacI family transcriptional regulator n=1 Tax=Candidatus Thermofonsia Clade 3 bacterium TaxID=2364212 RepID=A0A2M8QAK0_9CHLR|nr:LacI family DNA-binding transcriptional regulator [Candidatus Roseilinea sp. NK_OTU-006]PJF46812.1 MAG: LacI family transcriptional regulator [Candidatus Thermofonsia Clade 3 bacterium]RMG63240.1 MAG: LacI family transcriptional regulator [Chloroflexota bacterium]